MNTYAIERKNSQFEVVMYERKWRWARFRWQQYRHVIHVCDRLMSAEQMLLGLVGEAYARKLDQERFAAVTVTIADCEPRANEEHIYTAIVLQEGNAPKRGELLDAGIFDVVERMADKKLSNVEKRLFIHRFMTWYARHNPEYQDPRLETMDEYSRAFAPIVSPAGRDPRSSTGIVRRMLNAMSGREV